MAVWRCVELFKGRKGALKDGSQREYTRVFRVRTNNKGDGSIAVLFAVDPNTGEFVPALYSSYFSFGSTEFDILAICRSVTPVQDEDDWTTWTVTCEYSTLSPNGDGAGQPSDGGNPGSGSGASNDPEQEPPSIDWGRWTQERPQQLDLDENNESSGKPILNSATQPFDPLPTREMGGRILIYERNENTYDSLAKDKYSFKLNSDEFVDGDDVGEWLCFPITAKQVYKGTLKYFRVHYEFHHCGDLGDWQWHMLDQGFDKLVNGKLVAITYAGQRPGVPELLDGEGNPLTKDALEASGPVYLPFVKYRNINFGPLGIDLNA